VAKFSNFFPQHKKKKTEKSTNTPKNTKNSPKILKNSIISEKKSEILIHSVNNLSVPKILVIFKYPENPESLQNQLFQCCQGGHLAVKKIRKFL
jgi:hypothetical protein